MGAARWTELWFDMTDHKKMRQTLSLIYYFGIVLCLARKDPPVGIRDVAVSLEHTKW